MSEISKRIFGEFILQKSLKATRQREAILNYFLSQKRHMSVHDLYLEIHKNEPRIGYATVSRTMKLFAEAGIAREVNFGDGQTRFEHAHPEEHHDHLVCTGCGAITEFANDAMEKIQGGIARKHGFLIQTHRLELYGLCVRCRT